MVVGREEAEEEGDVCAFRPVVMSRGAFCPLLSLTLRRHCVLVLMPLGAINSGHSLHFITGRSFAAVQGAEMKQENCHSKWLHARADVGAGWHRVTGGAWKRRGGAGDEEQGAARGV